VPQYKFLLCVVSILIFGCQPFLQGTATPLPQNQKKKPADSRAKAKSEEPEQRWADRGDSQHSDQLDGDREGAIKDSAAGLLPERAKLILGQLSQEAGQWKKKDVAAGLLAQIADLLWENEPASARDILVSAWEKARSVEDKKQERSAYRNYSKRVEVMRQVMLVAKRRDEGLAEKWIEEMADEKEEEKQ
jgi:hypothetical protein